MPTSMGSAHLQQLSPDSAAGARGQARHPDAAIVFGGPQASAVAVETLEAFPFVDVVVRGEAEQTLPELLTALGCANGLAGVAGITFRRNEVWLHPRFAGPAGSRPTSHARLSPVAWHREAADHSLEVGRGCPFACTFCSTSEFFRRRFRLKTPARVIEQMKALHQTYGTATFNLVHDTFTAVRAQVVEFCHFLLNCGCKFEWTCSARTDCVDEELLALMARAGCGDSFSVSRADRPAYSAPSASASISNTRPPQSVARPIIACAPPFR